MRVSALIFCAVLLSGCMIARGPDFTDAPAPGNNNALVYIYWPANFVAAARTADIYIDDAQVASLNAGGYAYVYVSPGSHKFSEKWEFSIFAPESLIEPPIGLEAEVHAGETRYIRFSTGVIPGAVVWHIEEAPPAEGRSELASERYQTKSPWAAYR